MIHYVYLVWHLEVVEQLSVDALDGFVVDDVLSNNRKYSVKL